MLLLRKSERAEDSDTLTKATTGRLLVLFKLSLHDKPRGSRPRGAAWVDSRELSLCGGNICLSFGFSPVPTRRLKVPRFRQCSPRFPPPHTHTSGSLWLSLSPTFSPTRSNLFNHHPAMSTESARKARKSLVIQRNLNLYHAFQALQRSKLPSNAQLNAGIDHVLEHSLPTNFKSDVSADGKQVVGLLRGESRWFVCEKLRWPLTFVPNRDRIVACWKGSPRHQESR